LLFGEGNEVIKLPLKAFTDGRDGFILFRKEEDLSRWISRVKPEPGFFDVAVHGEVDHVAYMFQGDVADAAARNAAKNWFNLSHDNLANLIKNNGWDGKSPIRLLSCHTGEQAGGLAQNLANKLGVPVKAPDNILWVWPHGKFVVGPVDPATIGKKTLLPDMKNLGGFVTLIPKKP